MQQILDERQRNKAGKSTRSFTYTGMVSCGHCECSLVGEMKKGRYVYYHCTGYRGNCGEPYTREEALEQQFAIGLKQLVIAPAILQWLKDGSCGIGPNRESCACADSAAGGSRTGTTPDAPRHVVRGPTRRPYRRSHVRQESGTSTPAGETDPATGPSLAKRRRSRRRATLSISWPVSARRRSDLADRTLANGAICCA